MWAATAEPMLPASKEMQATQAQNVNQNHCVAPGRYMKAVAPVIAEADATTTSLHPCSSCIGSTAVYFLLAALHAA
jgi:hypothetical protein